MGSRKLVSKEETHDRSMARLLIILVVLAVFVLVQSASQKVTENSYNRPVLGDGEDPGSGRTKRSRANSRYNPASAQTNPNRGRKRVRLTDGRPETPARAEPPPPTQDRGVARFQEPQPTRAPQNFNRGNARTQQPQTRTRSRNLNRGGSRNQVTRQRPATRNFESTTPRARVANRLTTRAPIPRNRNNKNNNNINRFYEETAVKRNELFFDTKSKYCRPGVNDFYDYNDYDQTDLESSQDEAPTHIEVTHQLPLATQRNNFLPPVIISSIEVLAVSELKSTDVDNLPVIYANAYTVTKQPGYKEILFDALRATETLQVTVAPTCLNGRQTSFSQVTTSTIYSVETITEKVFQEVIPTDNLNDLLLKFLPKTNTPEANLFLPSNQVVITTAPLTTFITHTSSYVTKITESESTELSLTFRGQPIVTTLIDTSVKEITATEFSTETVITSQLITKTQPVIQTTLPALPQSEGDLEQQVLLAELSKLLGQQATPTPPLVTPAPSKEEKTQTYEVTHTSTYVTTLTEENSQVIPLTFRGKAVETTLYDTATKVIAATEYSTEVVTTVATPTPQAPNLLPLPQINNQGLLDILPDIVGQLALLGNNPLIGNLNPQPEEIFNQNTPETLSDSLLEQQLIEALAGDLYNDNEIEQDSKVPAPAPIIKDSPTVQVPAAPEFSVTTIFKSGKSPGDFTRVVSTIYFDEKRKKREAGIDPSRATIEDRTVIALLEPIMPEVDEYDFNFDLIQSGRYF